MNVGTWRVYAVSVSNLTRGQYVVVPCYRVPAQTKRVGGYVLHTLGMRGLGSDQYVLGVN